MKPYKPQRQLLRLQDVLKRLAISKSTLYKRIDDGLLPPSINLGGRAVAWVEDEVAQVIEALIQGQSADELKQLVSHLVKQRSGATNP